MGQGLESTRLGIDKAWNRAVFNDPPSCDFGQVPGMFRRHALRETGWFRTSRSNFCQTSPLRCSGVSSGPRQSMLSGLDLNPRKLALLARGAFELQGVLILLALLGVAYAAGYYTRDRISRRRHEHARVWRNYTEPEWPRPANTNKAPLKARHGDLGQMLNRWEDRARLRRAHR
jgi:hypothetical protein